MYGCDVLNELGSNEASTRDLSRPKGTRRRLHRCEETRRNSQKYKTSGEGLGPHRWTQTNVGECYELFPPNMPPIELPKLPRSSPPEPPWPLTN